MANYLQNFSLILISTILLWNSCQCDGAKILFYIGGISSHSHRVAIQPLANKLAERGHQVTFFAPLGNSASHPNITDFVPAELKAFNTAFLEQFGVQGLQTRLGKIFANELLEGTALMDASYLSCSFAFGSPEMKPWAEKQSFDLVVIDTVGNECAFALVHYFKAKSIIFGPISTLMPWDPDTFGFPAESSWFPTLDNNYEGNMGWKERWVNTLSSVYWTRKYNSYHLPKLDQLVRDTFGVTDMPPLIDMVKKTDLMFLNQHYSDSFARSFPPCIIPVGGMHLQKEHKPLPPDMEKFIQGGGDAGFIYVSFGSVVKISTIPMTTFQIFFDAFGNSSQRFLWKWEDAIPENVPKNIYFKSWFPQQDVLAHPKIKGYIMQGGQISIQQALCNSVPLIMFPVNGDQDINAKRLRSVRNGIEMEFANLTVPYLQNAIHKLVYDPSYSLKAKQMGKVCKDRILSPVDTALWWTEYVLRMENTEHLKPLSISQSWWIYRSLDIFGVIFFLFFLTILAALCLLNFIQKLYKRFNSPASSTVKSKQS